MNKDEEIKARKEALAMFKDHENLILIGSDRKRDPGMGMVAMGDMPGNMEAIHRVLGSDHPLSRMMWNVIRNLMEDGTVTFEDDAIIIDSITTARTVMNKEWIGKKEDKTVPMVHYGKPGDA